MKKMASLSVALHILATNSSEGWDYLWDWLGDREVFFCKERDNIFTGNTQTMLECFQLLHYVDGLLFWKLRSNAVELGMLDVMGSFLDEDLGEEEIGVLMTHDNNGNDIDVIEQWKTVPLKWWLSYKDKPNIRQIVGEC